jgi:uncharacterized protein (DUF1697 family)
VRNVETFIASGNVIFDASVKNPVALERKAEKCLRAALGYDVGTYIRSIDEVAEIARRRPFSESAFTHGAVVYVGLLPDAPGPAECRKLMALASDVDDFHVSQREVHWLCRMELQRSRSAGPPLEKVLGMRATLRNVRTLQRIAEKYGSATVKRS